MTTRRWFEFVSTRYRSSGSICPRPSFCRILSTTLSLPCFPSSPPPVPRPLATAASVHVLRPSGCFPRPISFDLSIRLPLAHASTARVLLCWEIRQIGCFLLRIRKQKRRQRNLHDICNKQKKTTMKNMYKIININLKYDFYEQFLLSFSKRYLI
ncbi:hypothetical protein PUN28_013569 [Cardiocondyla obscurior]|uniref:Uncharacterized protein n=1 Tax=Cardiocondyla obscurior TaxID=286306 RepID=A0AAW2F577_9HYME